MNSNFWGGWPEVGVGATGGGAITFPGGVLILGGTTGSPNAQPVYQQAVAGNNMLMLVLLALAVFLIARKK